MKSHDPVPVPAVPYSALVEFALERPDAPPTSFVRMGLWDNAFYDSEKLLNLPDPSQNFVDCDSRRFYIRVVDPSASKRDFVDVEWRTYYGGGLLMDENRGVTLQDARITLL